MKRLIVVSVIALIITACGSNKTEEEKQVVAGSVNENAEGTNPAYDQKRGEGKFSKVEISPNLDPAKAEAGDKVFSVKCSACHKLTDEKLVGPGWKSVTGRHSAEWIMNFVTNPDVMLDKDPKAQAMLELCLVRMPNQNISDDDARNVYEFMRKNDGVK
ncbi:MAG: c-type cytochrome [Flavitalea sp.]